MAGMSGIAQAGMHAARTGAVGIARRAGGNLQSRHTAGARSAFRATGGQGVPDAPATGAQDTSPAWARHIRRTQGLRDAQMMAISAVRDGDRPGGGLSIELRSDED
tara:strand:- start:641 stop:958 length:318 start_codon:yes stop_codon:yes gene_type:complete